MSRITKWKPEKAKVKVVFRLQFHATLGSSRSSLLGEANINLADYGDASNPSSVTLPLQGCNYGTLLHVTVQLLTSKTGFREFEQQRVSRERGLQIAANSNVNGTPGDASESASDQRDKVNARVRFKSESKELPSLEENVELNGDYAESATGVDDSSNTSESYCAEKHDSSTHEIESLKSTISGAERSDPSDHRLLTHGSNEWVQGWSSDYSIDNDLAAAYEENSRLRGSLEVAETSILELKLEVNSLRSQADALGVETQKFTQLLSLEVVSGEELAKEVSLLKSECKKFKDDFEHLKHSKSSPRVDSTSSFRHRICDLEVELEESKAERISLIRKMNEMESYYEGLINDLEETQKQMMGELQNLKYEHSSCLYTISSCESQMEKMHENMNNQLLRFSEDRCHLESLNKELEGRAMAAETTLKGARWNYSIAVDHLQKDLELLSLQVMSMFETNENLIRQAFADTSQSYFQDYVEENSEADHSYLHKKIESVVTPRQVFSLQKVVEAKKNVGIHGKLNLEKEAHEVLNAPDLSICLRGQFPGMVSQSKLVSLEYGTVELSEMLVLNIYSDVFSKVLQESLLEAIRGAVIMEEKIGELAQLLAHSIESKELLMLEVKAEREHKTDYVTKCNKLTIENQFFEEKLKGTADENYFLKEKVTDLEKMILEYKRETVEKRSLQTEVRSLQKELKTLKEDFDEHSSIKQNLEKTLSSMIVKLGYLWSTLVSYDEKDDVPFLQSEPFHQISDHTNFMSNILQLDVLHKKVYETILQVSEVKKGLKEQRDVARDRLSSAESEILFMKQKYESDIQNMATKLDVSNALADKLHIELKKVSDKLPICSEAEERCVEHFKEISSKLGLLEAELQDVTSENKDLAKKVIALESVNEELENTKSTLINSAQENQFLLISLQASSEESMNLDELQKKTHEKILRLTEENKDLENERDVGRGILSSVESKVLTMKKKYESEIQTMVIKLEVSNTLVDKLQIELKDVADKLTVTLEAEERCVEQFKEISSKFSLLEVVLQQVTFENMDLARKLVALESVNEELETAKLTIAKSEQENQALFMSLQVRNEESTNLDELQKKLYEKILQLSEEKKELEKQRDVARGDIQNMATKLYVSDALVVKLQLELKNVVDKFTFSSEIEERYEDLIKNITSKLAVLEVEAQHVTTENKDLAQKLVDLECVNEELEKAKFTIVNSSRENQALLLSLQAGYEESVNLSKELSCTKENLEYTRGDLHCERNLRVELEGRITDLISQLNAKNGQLLFFENERTELANLKQLVSDLELDKSKVWHLLVHAEENLRKADKNASSLSLQVTDLESHLAGTHESLLASDTELVFTRNQYQTRMHELALQLETLDKCYRELHLQHLDVLTTLNVRISGEAQYIAENVRLSKGLNLLRSEFEATVTEKVAMMERNNVILIELEEYKVKAATAKTSEIEHLKHMLVSSEEVIDNLTCSREELEIMVTLLKGKLDEQRVQISLVNHELSKEILKTEELKNLSVHLKELKEKADAECLQAREKRQTIGPQESLRMAFIREQCETKVQDLRNQLFLSTKHREEILIKLQNALDEVENLKKSEASHMKRNEELSLKILELESDLHTVISEKRERIKACDEMKAELECSLISLDCCKEEKRSLEASLHDCVKERTRISDEFNSTKKQVQSSVSAPDSQEGFKGLVVNSKSFKSLKEDASYREAAHGVAIQACLSSKSLIEASGQAIVDQKDLNQLALINESFKAQSLKSSMNHLHKELERLKNENLGSLSKHENHFETPFQGLQRELLQLHKVNEQLGRIFPLFNQFFDSGNALERVLALELELAESLQAKKSNVHFQSSFLKQHSDEEAIFQSFRDINELIKEMLELKGRYAAVETELKEMHDRYSQLSLQFAEVEGEREKLVMTLKNARIPKNSSSYLYRSTSASLDDNL
ncbi:hypothetical protein GIB67_026102 [Kingdonia uniflora]|uniref:C2 NT-type domain-containing protein n=1 Tax=Kingdonia uniflora TaxID=39325 RepID=A0A7J7M327_9MAGN|nr:hypothetical protein GIB67_026102 [Kingdonia uniflora]